MSAVTAPDLARAALAHARTLLAALPLPLAAACTVAIDATEQSIVDPSAWVRALTTHTICLRTAMACGHAGVAREYHEWLVVEAALDLALAIARHSADTGRRAA